MLNNSAICTVQQQEWFLYQLGRYQTAIIYVHQFSLFIQIVIWTILWYANIFQSDQVAQIFQSSGFDIRYNVGLLKIYLEWAEINQLV